MNFWLFSAFFFDVDVVVVVAVIILVGLFSMQHYGTDRVGWLFAPVVLLWFLLIGGIGIFNIRKYDSSVLKAFSPVYIYRYLRKGGKDRWTSLGGILLSITGDCSLFVSFTFNFLLQKSFSALGFQHLVKVIKCMTVFWTSYDFFLIITGTEALFADLAHFPVSAIQLAFTIVVFPCLLLAYSGQAAYLMQNSDHVMDAFYRSIPGLIWTVLGYCSLSHEKKPDCCWDNGIPANTGQSMKDQMIKKKSNLFRIFNSWQIFYFGQFIIIAKN